MKQIRNIRLKSKSISTLEGAGVRLKRAFGQQTKPRLDPFLLLDNFRSDNPSDYLAGFPWHPHRGIETITYLLEGAVEHGDSLGNKGIISAGDVQWMTAGGGIIHQEMPKGDAEGHMWGLQLWANLPASAKMMPPRYRDVTAEQIPVVELVGGIQVKVVAGTVQKIQGPVRDIVIDPEYLDVTLPPAIEFEHPVKPGYTVFAYLLSGAGRFEPEGQTRCETEDLVVFGDGEAIRVGAGEEGVRFLLISGKPLREPVAWYGPIVMNTMEELETAFREYEEGTFLKQKM